MKRLCRAAAVVVVLALVVQAPPVRAGVCAPDVVPAATLLFPYFESDVESCSGGQGVVTVVWVSNATPAPVLAGVTLWGDLGMPVMGFQVYLPGYGVQGINLSDIFCRGIVPSTGSAISPHGPSSDPPVFFAGCNNSPVPDGAPNYVVPIPAVFQLHIVSSLTGQPSPYDGKFRGVDYGDNIARGFITVDTLNVCTLRFPTDAGYFFPGGSGDAANANALLGEEIVLDPANNFAQAFPAAHLEASINLVPGNYTFYGAKGYTNSWTADDGREPLPTTFAAPFAAGGPYDAGSSVLAWRERTGPIDPKPYPGTTDPLPLGAQSIVSFDETTAAESFYVLPTLPGDPGMFLVFYPLVTQRNLGNEGCAFENGWKFLDFRNTQFDFGGDAGQSSVITVRSWEGRFSTANTAAALDSSCTDTGGTPLTITITPTGGVASDPYTPWVFWADFEDALAGWSQVVGTP